MGYFQKLVGERVYLSPLCSEDAERYTKWLNDSHVTDGLGATAQMNSLTSEQKWLEGAVYEQQYAIVRREDNALLGSCGFNTISHLHQTAEVGILLGEAENRGKGYGTEALSLLVSYGFMSLNLHNIMLKVFAFNEQAVACYKRVGFREFGRRRQAYFCQGRFHDEIYMELLREQWESR